MPKRRGKQIQTDDTDSDSDDSRAYENDSDPDSDEFFHDEVDDFHDDQEKVLLKGVREDLDDDGEEWESDNEQEVLGLDLSDDDDEEISGYKKQLWRLRQNKKKSEMGSDLEDEADLPDIKTFGKKRSHYYGADVGDYDIDVSGSSDDEGAAALEEKEALAMQQKIAQQLDEQDFGLDIFKPETTATESNEEKIVKDLTKLSKREKLQLLKKESPELMTLIEDFKTKMTEVRDTLLPLLKVVREGKLQGKAAQYVDTKCKLNLNYCTNISFYMMLKAKQLPVHNHPVIRRLVQYRNLMKQLEPVDDQVREEMLDIVKRLRNGEDVDFDGVAEETKTFVRRDKKKNKRQRQEKQKLSNLISDSEEDKEISEDPKLKKKKVRDGRYETTDEKAALAYYDMMKEGKKTKEEDEDSTMEDDIVKEPEEDEKPLDEDDDEDGKRAITYQIEKNKGLTPKRKKEQRNPRVKHRMKYRKAKIRRRGQIREPRTEMSRYGGEISGIRAGVKRSIKMRV